MGGSSSGGGGGGGNNNIKKKVVNALTPAPIKIIKGLKKAAKTSRQNVLDYEGQAAGVTPMRNPFPKRDGGNDRDNTTRVTAKSRKSIEQPKTETQFNSPTPDTSPKGPTESEMPDTEIMADVAVNEDEETLKRKKRGRRSTVLTSITGDTSEVKLSRPTLLGG